MTNLTPPQAATLLQMAALGVKQFEADFNGAMQALQAIVNPPPTEPAPAEAQEPAK